ncbi:MAG: SPOR domain-containing protein [Prevotella sp.]|nr:SPOR domain-containing protein [Prevotella sp.]
MIELDRHIEILLLNNDCVIIPNFGGFMAHYVEAKKDERDSAFLPPMRTIGFNPKLILNDSLLAQSYVEVYDISYPDALARIADEVRELKQRIEHDEEYEMNDIGVLRLNDNGNLEFEPCDAGILTPSLYGLSYYNFKTLAQIEQEQAEKELKKSVAQVVDLQQEVQLPASEPYQYMEEDETETTHSRRMTALWRNIAVACAAFIIFLLIPTPLANNKSKYVESRVNTQLLDYVMPKEMTHGENPIEEMVKSTSRATSSPQTKSMGATTSSQEKTGFTIVLASKVSKKNAVAYIEDLHRRGYHSAEMLSRNNNTQVVFGNYATQKKAYEAMNKLRQDQEFGEAWIMKY